MTTIPYSFKRFLITNTKYKWGRRITKKLVMKAIINDLLGVPSTTTLSMVKQNVSIVYKKAYADLLRDKPSAVRVSVYLLYLAGFKKSKEIRPLIEFPTYSKSWDGHYDSTIEGRVQYRTDNKEHIQKYMQNYQKNKSDKIAYISAKRRASKIKATPCWLTNSDTTLIQKYYTEAKQLQEATGEKFHVDHIIPLQGKNVCGLHVPWNLQVLPAKDNLTKSNKFKEENSYHC